MIREFNNRTRQRRRASQRHLDDEDLLLDRRSKPVSEVGIAGIDKILFYVIVALALIGITAVYSASAMEAMESYNNTGYFAIRQLIFFIVGFGLMWTLSRVSFFNWIRWTKPIALLVIGLLFYTMHNGVEAYGAERWVNIFGIQFQPSELAKLSVILLLSQALSATSGRVSKLNWLINMAMVGVTIMLVYQQPSLSMTIILASVSACMFIISGTPVWMVLGLAGIGGAVVVNKLMHTEYQLRRIMGWINPWKDPQDTGYNIIQSLYAIGSGGLFGTGLGMSHQKLYYLPFQYTDFIFAVWAEEWGLIGCVLLLGLYITMLYRCFVISRHCKSPFGQLLGFGITLVLAGQIIINVSVATGLFPVTGVTLPLISYGGTSVLITMAMLGIMLNLSRYRTTLSQIRPIHEIIR